MLKRANLLLLVLIGGILMGCTGAKKEIILSYNKKEIVCSIDIIDALYIPNIEMVSTIRNVEYMSSIYEFDHLTDLGNDYAYNKYVTAANDIFMYAIYPMSSKTEDLYNLTLRYMFYSDKWYIENDFWDVTIGATISDVELIDKTINFKINCGNYYGETFHLCNNGYLKLLWSQNESNELSVSDKVFIEMNLITKLHDNEVTNK